MRLRHSHVPPTPRSSPATDASSLAGADASPAVDAVAGAAGALLALLQHVPAHDPQHQAAHRARRETFPRARGGTRTHTRRRVSMMDELRAVAKEDGGLAGLYRGIEPAVIGTVTSQTVYNYVYASLRVATARMKNKGVREKNSSGAAGLGALESLAIASVAGSINVVLTIPIWTVCVRMQAERANEGEGKVSSPNAAARGAERGAERDDDEKNDGVFSRTLRALKKKARAAASSDGSVSSRASGSARDTRGGMDERGPPVRKKTFLETTGAVWEENGLAGFWRGVTPSLIMVSNPALQYAFYESASDAFRRRRAKTQRGVAGSSPSGTLGALTAWEVFVAASLAKMGATVLTYPVLLVKTRLQASGSRGGKKNRKRRSRARRLRTTARSTRCAASRARRAWRRSTAGWARR